MTSKSLSASSSATPTSWRWHDDKYRQQRREDRLIAAGLIVCLLIQAALLARPLWN